jgi:spermidine synthase
MGKVIPSFPTWKLIFSHLREIKLEEFYSKKNGHIELFLRKGRLMLCAQNAIYSYDDRYKNFDLAFQSIPRSKMKKIQTVLVLGMGLGSIPLILEKQNGRIFDFTLVEYDEDIAALAQKYSLDRLDSPVQIAVTDAEVYVNTSLDSFDLVCIDLFEDHEVPKQFQTPQFLKNCKSLLADQGILLYNTPANQPYELEASSNFFTEIFLKVFPQGEKKHFFKNFILFSKEV